MALFAVVVIVVAMGAFVWLHSRKLTTVQVADLAARRRSAKIKAYFRFHGAPVMADAAFKQKMPARGGWFNVDCPLEVWPATAAALFKYKKHEWIIVAFLHGRQVSRLWINKGADNKSVGLPINPQLLLEECSRGGFSSVFFHHNHPNPSPRVLYMLFPSRQDAVFAEQYAAALVAGGVNVLQFVCERGRFQCFHSRIADQFMPVARFRDQVAQRNGVSWYSNLGLHMERLFARR